MGIVVILIIVAVIIAIEVPLMLRKNLIKEFWVFLFLLLLGTFFSLIYVMNISISDPLAWMVFIYKPVADMVNAWLS
ncbi:hypothetical protein NYE25_22305 [Paenibacillus sp. FSL E2-8871]|uniref:Uncharacterized protein n=1 Tax=Paenibacillus odorifer TaxID=189426 RepID=A0A1R0Z9C0_9BACL|nr:MULTISPECIES: hypothetical protein [Paenibacillus]OMD49698.1 hypothetical protein BSK51_18735 [Paenibacillus odorifer]OME64865.1 hypothetical protein BSK65_26500 [Paenibacillus odorifer]WHY19697.1 hypothetical protein QNH28_01235 [Paenibacillus sp. G2S3]